MTLYDDSERDDTVVDEFETPPTIPRCHECGSIVWVVVARDVVRQLDDRCIRSVDGRYWYCSNTGWVAYNTKGDDMRKKLGPEHTAICKRCRHGKAAHKNGKCAMKYCKCVEYTP